MKLVRRIKRDWEETKDNITKYDMAILKGKILISTIQAILIYASYNLIKINNAVSHEEYLKDFNIFARTWIYAGVVLFFFFLVIKGRDLKKRLIKNVRKAQRTEKKLQRLMNN